MPFPLRTPPFLLLEPPVRLALEEDLGRAGDLSDALEALGSDDGEPGEAGEAPDGADAFRGSEDPDDEA